MLGTSKAFALGKELAYAGNDIPSGVIVMWSGTTTDIPTGWTLCNGSNGTPDLRDRFVLGAGNTYQPGNIGGEVSHTLTVAEMPSHTHTLSLSGLTTSSAGSHSHTFNTRGASAGSTGGPFDTTAGAVRTVSTSSSGEHTHTISGSGTIANTGSGSAHNNMPPYYALCFIMKL